jgi:hypothetical protein
MDYRNAISRMSIIPHNENMSNDERYVPLKSLVGPFDFPLEYFRRKLQAGNQVFGDFAKYDSNARKSATSFCHKKVMDFMLYIFDELRNKPKRIRAKRAFCLMRLKESAVEDGVDADWIRSCGDLSKAYSKVYSFSFFIEVEKKSESQDEGNGDVTSDFKDLDDIIQKLYRTVADDGDEESAPVPKRQAEEPPKKRIRAESSFHAGNNQQSRIFNTDKESAELIETAKSNFQIGQTICGAVAQFRVADGDQLQDLRDLPYAPSRVWSLQALWERCQEEGNAEESRMPREFVVQTEVHGPCIDLCKGLSFGVLSDNFVRVKFGLLGFPDIRKKTADYNVPVPDDDTMTAVVSIPLDMSVQTKGVSAFYATRERLAPSRYDMEQACLNPTLSLEQKHDLRAEWQQQALVPFKSIFNERSCISLSIKKMVALWEHANEKDHGPGKPSGISIPSLRVQAHANLDRQGDYIAALYDFAELVGFYCHHSIFICMLIDSLFACRKGAQKGPHTILFGDPGSGKSYILEVVLECLQALGKKIFGTKLSFMSRLSWATKDPNNPDNPETMQTQIAMFWDEVPASFLGASDSKHGESDDVVAAWKEMLTASVLSYQRNIEVLTKDGLKGRGFEEADITNEPVFFGGMNRAPGGINPAFKRRICFKTCVQFQRADGVTFESAFKQEQATKEDPLRMRWMAALRINAQLHLLVSTAEYCGILLEPNIDIWHGLIESFKAELAKFVSVANLLDRISDAKTRLILLTRRIAIFETYQSGEDQVLSFDEIVSKLSEVEKRCIAGERLCISVLSSLDDTCFPLMHKVVLNSIILKWPDIHLETVDNVYTSDNRSFGTYVRIPLSGKRNTKGFTSCEWAAMQMYDMLHAIISTETKRYKLGDSKNLAIAAIQELISVMSPDHPVIVVVDDFDNGTVDVFISLIRLRNKDASIKDVIRKISGAGTQLMLTPHQDPILPQFPSYVEDGDAGPSVLDDRVFKKRCAALFIDSAEARDQYHHTLSNRGEPRQGHYPKDRVEAVMH